MSELRTGLKLRKPDEKIDPRTLWMEKYIDFSVLTPPKEYTWGKKIKQWNMLANDQYGDCAVASAGHLIMDWVISASNQTFVPTDKQILDAYAIISGSDPRKPGGQDNGCYLLDVLKYWQNTGIAGHKIGPYVAIDPTNLKHMQLAIWLFGGVYGGVALPLDTQSEVNAGKKTWYIKPGSNVNDSNGTAYPGSWGGHGIPYREYNRFNQYGIISWGEEFLVTQAWQNAYADMNMGGEAYAIVSPDWFYQNKAPNGFNLAALQADLNLVKNSKWHNLVERIKHYV